MTHALMPPARIADERVRVPGERVGTGRALLLSPDGSGVVRVRRETDRFGSRAAAD